MTTSIELMTRNLDVDEKLEHPGLKNVDRKAIRYA